MSDSPVSNDHAVSVSELAASLKRTIESNFDHVVVRGELGRVTIARSGHMYADIKDEKAVLNTIMWKGQVDKLPFRPEEGLEVIATGRLSIYEGRSNYQLIASSMRPAGAGALMALLEERKKKLAAEGLFEASHKKKLPYLPRTIGVITSPTGAVIRDILHRIQDRFPVRVIVWPALVQGDAAAAQVTAGIKGFNAMTGADRPDVLIVARGGGSIEDLWPFNEEIVVRAAFESEIPLISAVGHETDTTLIDYVSDARAPTPTGAAEIAVPVRNELLLSVEENGARLKRALARRAGRARDALRAARLPRAETLLQSKRQRLDYAGASLPRATRTLIERAKARLAVAQVSPSGLRADIRRARQSLRETAVRARPALLRLIDRRKVALSSQAKLLETLSYQATLQRGYTIIRAPDGKLVRSAGVAAAQARFTVSFADGDVAASPVDGTTATATPAPERKAKKAPAKGGQGSLF
ncbi:exodeoxyribonuclease VII large subunit [Hyphomonas johnsonii]|uniref:Exodeoxyribonuclease 7 large subunit n=1 Tax=Hyphomonas johnsonii MHS-2 TaxID=1280950 RepID=A0A059FUG9_9PROT|nr:exodeoxyribonuclease VII large subunit [Hyphomonas johnsonii]KCZ94146.1 exodeoxyribonuclease VII large subunit [Hyphomonas johnsonii MHS-2]